MEFADEVKAALFKCALQCNAVPQEREKDAGVSKVL